MNVFPLLVVSTSRGLPIIGSNFVFKAGDSYQNYLLYKKNPIVFLAFSNLSEAKLKTMDEHEKLSTIVSNVVLLGEVKKIATVSNGATSVTIACKATFRVSNVQLGPYEMMWASDADAQKEDWDDQSKTNIKRLHNIVRNFLPKIYNKLEDKEKILIETTENPQITMSLLASVACLKKDYDRLFFEEDVISKMLILTKAIEYAKNKNETPRDEKPKIEKKENDFPEMPEKVRTKYLYEKNRLKNMKTESGEYSPLSEYINTLESIPWGKYSSKPVDLKNILNVLSESHYGLEDVKETIREHLLIEQLTKGTKGSVLCFTGNPGTGKTSIAKAIAKATNRQVIQIALGGVSDEAEIRGHRRTYVGSRPGRIVNGIKSEGTMDPLIILDEIDKISMLRGDPSSALLELLDPEQNNEFTDRYLELPVDLSRAMFICTANEINMIPAALKDRLEMIHFRDYSVAEKKTIAEKYMFPSIKKEFGIQSLDISVKDWSFIEKIKGLREIKSALKKQLRKAAVKIIIDEERSVTISPSDFLSLSPQKSTIGFGKSVKNSTLPTAEGTD